MPLANKIRPKNLEDVFGQKHLLGKNGVLSRIINSSNIPNMIFFGPSGTGKTTVAEITANKSDKKIYKLNATTASISDIKEIISELDTFIAPNGAVLYLDEIQYFSKKQQQSLLEFIENGKITLIAATTENPNFYIHTALLSRCTLFEFKALETQDLQELISNANKNLDDKIVKLLSENVDGDARKAINIVEILGALNENPSINDARAVLGKSLIKYDKDTYYDILSAFQKSIRGSDPDAAIYYLAMLINAGDLISICRRLLVIACEDIGLAYPMAITIVKACTDSARELGFPEARIPLSQATIMLATSPKSNSAYIALENATNSLNGINIPESIKFGSKTYKYPHNYKNSYVSQQYLLKKQTFYNYGENKTEQIAKSYWDKIKTD